MARVLAWYSVAMVAIGVTYALAATVRPELLGVAGLAGVAAIETGIRRFRPSRVSAWRCLQAALVLLALGDILFLSIGSDSAAAVPYPEDSDLITVVGYFVLSVALFWLGRPTARSRDETSLIDAFALTVAVTLVLWVTLVRPAVESQALLEAGRFGAGGALMGYVAVVAASVRLALGWRRNAAVLLLSAALIWFLLSELFHGYQLVRGGWPSGGRIDLGYIALAGLSGAAGLTRSMRDVSSPLARRHSLTPFRLALIAAALVVAPVLLIVEAARGSVQSGLSIAAATILVSILVLVRLSMSGRAYQRRAAREHAARFASQAMVSAVTAADVVAGTRDALRSLWDRYGVIDLELVDRRELDHPPGVVVPIVRRHREQLAVALTGSDAAFVFTGQRRRLAEVADLLRSLGDQAAVALQRIGLAEAAGAEDRERYFRTLVLTSTDAILISRDGRIEYATPSASAIFGRDVLGEAFDDVVRPVDGRIGPQWPDVVESAEGTVRRPDDDMVVLVHRRDLTGDPTVRGVVTTLRDVTAERALQRDLAYRASHDELTDLANARLWGETLSAERDRRRGPGDGVAVIFIDLDDFKAVNDRFGHPAGDRFLADVAARIRECLRAGDVAARVGGDEFAVLLRNLSDVEDARRVAQRLAEALARPAQVDTTPVDSKASIGLSYSEGQVRIESLVRQADTALYAAKEQGKGRWTEYNPVQWAPRRTTVAPAEGGEPAR